MHFNYLSLHILIRLFFKTVLDKVGFTNMVKMRFFQEGEASTKRKAEDEDDEEDEEAPAKKAKKYVISDEDDDEDDDE